MKTFALALAFATLAPSYAYAKGEIDTIAHVRDVKTLDDLKNAIEQIRKAADKAKGKDKEVLTATFWLMVNSANVLVDACAGVSK